MNDKSFESFMNKSIYSLNIEFKPGQKVRGMVVSSDKRSVFIDINSKSEGIINREELLDENGELKVKAGDEIDAFFVSESDGEIILTVKMTGKFINSHLEDAYASHIPVEGKVTAERKGGYEVKIASKEAFCPYSQIDLYPKSPNLYLGNTYSFIITEMNRFNTVVSRRKLLEKSRIERIAYLKETLNEGDIISADVITIKNFGVFVDMDGCEGFIPISEISWGHVNDPSEILKVGDRINVAVKTLNWAENKITLSFRSAQDSWDEIEEKYPKGKIVKAKITRLEPFGAFAEIEKGLDGLIHISQLAPGKRIKHAKEAVALGDIVDVVIENVDVEAHRISLSRDFSGQLESSEGETEMFHVLSENDITSGIVEGIKPFGIFVKLNPVQTGLLHISELKNEVDRDASIKAISKKFPLGSSISVKIKANISGKISLELADKTEDAEQTAWNDYKKSNHKSAFGSSMADAFDKLNL